MKQYIFKKTIRGKISIWFTAIAALPLISIIIIIFAMSSLFMEQNSGALKTWLILASLLYTLLAAVLGHFLGNKISEPIVKTAKNIRSVSTGELTIHTRSVPGFRELAELDASCHGLIKNLQQVADVLAEISRGNLKVEFSSKSENHLFDQAIKLMVDNFKNQTGQIREAVEVLAASATEISASSTQVTAGASESSVAIAETTTTLDEVRQTAQVAKEKAKDVSERANRSMEISRHGILATRDSLAGMEQISKQMDFVAEAIMKLSEQSQSIGGIIATVNDISDQSNMLSVNAAIEASKAGEFGKGFAVVADEVRNLSEQSKIATEQVRKILHNIAKATGTAVMATEQGSKAVQKGMELVSQASTAIEELSLSIEEAARAAVQISASSQQQVVGVDQMVTAMENIKLSSSQNVSSMSQLEDSTRELTNIGEKLNTLMGQYLL